MPKIQAHRKGSPERRFLPLPRSPSTVTVHELHRLASARRPALSTGQGWPPCGGARPWPRDGLSSPTGESGIQWARYCDCEKKSVQAILRSPAHRRYRARNETCALQVHPVQWPTRDVEGLADVVSWSALLCAAVDTPGASGDLQGSFSRMVHGCPWGRPEPPALGCHPGGTTCPSRSLPEMPCAPGPSP